MRGIYFDNPRGISRGFLFMSCLLGSVQGGKTSPIFFNSSFFSTYLFSISNGKGNPGKGLRANFHFNRNKKRATFQWPVSLNCHIFRLLKFEVCSIEHPVAELDHKLTTSIGPGFICFPNIGIGIC